MASSTPATASQPEEVPGEPKATTTSVLETTASWMQSLAPVSSIHQHLCAFHLYGDNATRQVEAHHFCSHLNEEVHQCLIYDTDQANARLIGVEYIVTEDVFKTLPEGEKQLWHSHEYEVKSGLLIAPGLPQPMEMSEMTQLVKTCGKTWHFWQFDRGDSLPLGLPQLMMAFTGDGQIEPTLVQTLEAEYGHSMLDKRKVRLRLEGPKGGPDPSADHWKSGKGFATEMREHDRTSRQSYQLFSAGNDTSCLVDNGPSVVHLSIVH